MNALALLTFIAVFSVFESSPGAVFSPQDLVTHHIAKRQTTVDATIECSNLIIEYQCGPSGYAQQLVNIALSCRNESYARITAGVCARNENGETCGVAATTFLANTNAASCSGAVTSGSCPSGCRNFLESASSNLGCCINTFINTTDNPNLLALYSDVLDYRLWNLCDVPLPAAGCGNTLSLEPPQDAQDCTVEEFVSRLVDYQCSPSVGQPLVNAVLRNDRCNIFATLLVDVCATNANGQTCAEAISLDLIGSAATDPLLTSLSTNCAGLVDTCNPSCQSAVTSIADSYGCCVNVYNNSETGVVLPSLSYSLWNSCEVDSPGFCNSSLTTSPLILPPTTDQAPSEFDSSTSNSLVLAPVYNWIVAWASLLLLKNLF